MRKSSIVYFCIAVLCILCVPVMAYIYLPAAFIYLLPAAVFLWLGIDVAIELYRIVSRFIISVCKKITVKVKKIDFGKFKKPDLKGFVKKLKQVNSPKMDIRQNVAVPAYKEEPVNDITSEDYKNIVYETASTEEKTANAEPAASYAEIIANYKEFGEYTTPAPEPAYVAPPEPPPPHPEPAYIAPPEPAYIAPPEPAYIAPPEPAYIAPPEPAYVAPPPPPPPVFPTETPETLPPRVIHPIYSDADSFDVVKKQLYNLDMITISAMAIMLSDTKAKAASPYIKSLNKTDIKVVLLKFLKETYNATDIDQLNRLFSKTYYKRKISKYMRRVTAFVKGGISDSLPKRNMWLVSRLKLSGNQTKAYIERICETLNSYESVKYISALSGNKEMSDSKRNYKLDHLSENYKDALIYLVDLLLTCTCISKMLFVERMIRRMPVNSEFRKIIENMANSIDDHNLIISKSRPVYKQFYQNDLGYINGDDLLYGMAITIMVNNVKKTKPLSVDSNIQKYGSSNYFLFERDMHTWLNNLAKEDNTTDIGTLILDRITQSIGDNYDVIIDALGELLNWESYYGQRVAFHKRERDKERYLRGDFENEVLEISKFKQKQ